MSSDSDAGGGNAFSKKPAGGFGKKPAAPASSGGAAAKPRRFLPTDSDDDDDDDKGKAKPAAGFGKSSTSASASAAKPSSGGSAGGFGKSAAAKPAAGKAARGSLAFDSDLDSDSASSSSSAADKSAKTALSSFAVKAPAPSLPAAHTTKIAGGFGKKKASAPSDSDSHSGSDSDLPAPSALFARRGTAGASSLASPRLGSSGGGGNGGYVPSAVAAAAAARSGALSVFADASTAIPASVPDPITGYRRCARPALTPQELAALTDGIDEFGQEGAFDSQRFVARYYRAHSAQTARAHLAKLQGRRALVKSTLKRYVAQRFEAALTVTRYLRANISTQRCFYFAVVSHAISYLASSWPLVF